MIYSLIAFAIMAVLWLLFGYLGTVYEVLETAGKGFLWLTIALAVVAAVFIALEVVIRIRDSKQTGGSNEQRNVKRESARRKQSKKQK